MRQPLRDDPASVPEEPDFFLAHEIAHQWWGQAVSGANYRERWLSEGFAQYAAALWVKERRGEAAFRNVLTRFARWVNRYDDEGPIHLGYRVGHLSNDAQGFRAVVYDKAAYVLHMLRALLGEEVFLRGLRLFQERHRFSKANADDLRSALEEAGGGDLAPYFRAFIYGTGLPRLSYRSRVAGSAGGYRVHLVVQAAGLPGPLPVEVRIDHAGGEIVHALTVSPGETLLDLDTPSRPRRVLLNADRGLLAKVDGS
jgi:aminopeptidase N